jgi:diguanylate cyclase (GGDEF)-like protein/PAS domain S-box-containing protein
MSMSDALAVSMSDAPADSEHSTEPSGRHANPDWLRELCVALGALPGVDGAAVMRIDGNRFPFVWDAAADFVEVDTLERALLAGPCRQAIDTGRAVEAASPADITNGWPLSGAAITRSGVGSLLVVPLPAGEPGWGTVVLLSRTAAHPTTGTVTASAPLAHLAGPRLTDLLSMFTRRPADPPAAPSSPPAVLSEELTGYGCTADPPESEARERELVTNGELFQQLPTAYLVMSPDLVIVDANAAYVALLRHSREDLIGRPVFEAFPPTPSALDDHGRNPLQLSFERALDTGRPDVMPLHQYNVIDPSTSAMKQRFWSLVHTPIRSRDGVVRLLVQRVQDVTDWVRAGNPDGFRGDDAAPVRVVEAELFQRMQELRAARASEAAAIAALAESEARARAVLETAADGIITMSTVGIVQSMNPAAERMFGYPAGDVVGRNIAMLMPEPHATGHDSYLQRYRQTGERRVIGIGREVFGRRADGTTFPIEMAVSEVTVGNPFYTGVLRDITQRKEMEQQLAHQSTHDPLTGLANRTLLMDRLEHAVARLTRHPGFVAVFFIDLDRFKPINDLYGHAAGDELLTCIAARLRRVVRTEDLVARWGGDEFVVLCEELNQTWAADVVVERITNVITEPVPLPAATIQPSASVGFVVDDGTHTPDQLLAMADNAMYRRKTQRRSV